MIDIWSVTYNYLRIRNDRLLLLTNTWWCSWSEPTSPAGSHELGLVLFLIKFVLRISESSSTSSRRILSGWYSVPYGLRILVVNAANSRDTLLLTLRSKPVFVHLAIIVKVIEHQVEVIVHFFR